ncbi:hypothetical protein ABPG72_010599 [Tetrahymena utriculariae]
MNKNSSQEGQYSKQEEAQSQQNVIKGSQRSDGTFRKDIKIREGFVNLLEHQKYVIPSRRADNVKQIQDKEPQRNNQTSQISDGKNQNYIQRGFMNRNQQNNGTLNQLNNSERHENNQKTIITRSNNYSKQNNESSNYNKLNEGDFPDFIDKIDSKNASISKDQVKNDQNSNVQQAKQSDNQQKQISDQQQNNSSNKTSQNKQQWVKEDEIQKNSSKEASKQQFNSQISNIVSTELVNKEKEQRKLQKKIREIEQLQQKQQNGVELQPEAMDKISKKDDYIKMLENLTLN